MTLPAGGSVTSDAAAVTVPAGSDVSVSVYVDGSSGPVTGHFRALDPGWESAPGDHSTDVTGSAFVTPVTTRFWVTGLAVSGSGDRGAVVALGDSITDGVGSRSGADHRWPDRLGARLRRAGVPLAVVDAGIGSNQLLRSTHRGGASALDRLDRDVLHQAGVRDVIVLEGINDIGLSDATAPELIRGYTQLGERLHAAGIRALVGTLTPFRGFYYYTPAKEAVRETVNRWLRTSDVFDGVVDFEAALASADDPDLLRPQYDSGDHLHPNDRGHQALADAVPLSALD